MRRGFTDEDGQLPERAGRQIGDDLNRRAGDFFEAAREIAGGFAQALPLVFGLGVRGRRTGGELAVGFEHARRDLDEDLRHAVAHERDLSTAGKWREEETKGDGREKAQGNHAASEARGRCNRKADDGCAAPPAERRLPAGSTSPHNGKGSFPLGLRQLLIRDAKPAGSSTARVPFAR